MAAVAATASRQFKAYVNEVAQAGGRPDYTRPPASDFLRTIFDAEQLASVPFNPSDKPWLLEWVQAAAAAFKTIAEFGVPPGQRIDAEQLGTQTTMLTEGPSLSMCVSRPDWSLKLKNSPIRTLQASAPHTTGSPRSSAMPLWRSGSLGRSADE